MEGVYIVTNRSFFSSYHTNSQLRVIMPDTETLHRIIQEIPTKQPDLQGPEVLRHSYRPQILPHGSLRLMK